MRLIVPKIVILHCSATPDFNESDVAFDRFSIDDIDRWHREKGWEKCGYHFVITRKGLIQTGRWCTKDQIEIGAHCHGENYCSIGVCYIGSKEPTSYQKDALSALYKLLKNIFGLTAKDWYPHNHFNRHKTCPGFDACVMKEILENGP